MPLIRNISKIIIRLLFCLLVILMAAFDAQKQSLHDKIAGTFVVKV
jgi:uncharacterized RDD family membrane protein YckC